MKAKSRFFPWVWILFLLFQVLVFSGCQGMLNAAFSESLPDQNGEISLPGLKTGATIRRDSMGIPFIQADNMEDAAFASGYADAADRLSQMVGESLTAQGRLSEMVGSEALEIDIFMRALGVKKRAEQAFASVDPDLLAILEAYAKGVNAYMWHHQQKLPMNLTLAGYRPDPWRALDSYYVFYLLCTGLSVNMGQELAYLSCASRVGARDAAWLAPIYPDEPIAIDEAAKLDGLDLDVLEKAARPVLAAADRVRDIMTLGAAASNNWAIAPGRCTKGASILANDTHLTLSLPSLWTLCHIRVPGQYDAAGISLAGIPGIVAGFNGHIAWGMTMVMGDDQDVFLEKIRTLNNKKHYMFQGLWHPTEERKELFQVKGGQAQERTIHETVHGPLLNLALSRPSTSFLVPNEVSSRYGLAVQWANEANDQTFLGFWDLGRAKNMDQARAATRKIRSMALNLVYASKEQVAWQVTGRFPVRKKGRGLFPSPGWEGEYDWAGFVDFHDLPHETDPESGFLATANNRTTGPDYPHVLSSSWFAPWREERIRQVLKRDDIHTMAGSMDLQYDQVSAMAAKVQRVLFNSIYTDDINLAIHRWGNSQRKTRAREALAALRVFDGDMSKSSRTAALAAAFIFAVTENTFADQLGPEDESIWKSFLELGKMSYSAQDDHLLVRGDDSPFWDDVKTPEKETKAQILAESLADAMDILELKMGKSKADWKWGRIHQYYFQTEGSRMSARMQFFKKMGMHMLSGYFNVGPFPAGGDYTTVNVSGYTPGENFQVWFIPEMRMVVDFGQEEPLHIVNSTGQSGNPASPHYEDGIHAWLDRDYNNMPFSPVRVREKYKSVLTLAPRYH